MILKIPDDLSASLGCILYVAGKRDIVSYLQILIEKEYLNKDFSLSEEGKKWFKKIEVDRIDDESILKLAHRYRNCFKDPTGRVLKPGATGNLKLLMERLKEFKEENPHYTDDHIIRAISNYVQSESVNNFKFLQKAHYTVKKSNTDKTYDSRLLTFCEELEDEEGIEDNEFGIDV